MNKNSPHTVYCYDRYAQHKLIAVALLSVGLLGLSLFMAAPAEPVEPSRLVQQLPRVEVVGKSQQTLMAERAQQLLDQTPSAAGVVVHQLPRVLVEGRRSDATQLAGAHSLEGRRLAQAVPTVRAQ